MLPELQPGVPIATRNRVWFKHNEASVHFIADVRTYLNGTCGIQWIKHGGIVP